MKSTSLHRLLALLFTFTLIAAACGGSDGDDDVSVAEDDSTVDDDQAVEAGDVAEGDVDTEIVEDTESVRQYGGTVTIGLEAEAVGLRPWEDTCSSPCYNMMQTIYDKLLEQDENEEFIPYLADSFTSNDDFTVWSLTLREGVKFHNGADFNAQTLVDMFPIQQEGANSAGQISSAKLTEVTATGDYAVDYTLSAPNSAFPTFLTRNGIGMVFDPAAATADAEGYSKAPIGTGPFMIDKRDIDNETTVVRNPDYWFSDSEGNQLPYLDSISFRPIPDEGTRLDSLLSGTVDAIQSLRQSTIRDARAAAEDTDLTLYEFQGNNVGGGMYNVKVPPLDDKRVRRGLTFMSNQDAVIEALGGEGISLPGSQFFSPDSPWYSEKVAAVYPQFEFEEGKALVQEYVDDPDRSDGKAVGEPIDVTLSCPPDPSLIASMQVSEQLWSTSGIVNVELTNFDQQTHINTALGAPPDYVGEHHVHCWRWSSQEDPSLPLGNELAPPDPATAEAAGVPGVVSPLNFSNFFSQTIFDNLVAATRTGDFDERYGLYEAVMLELAEEMPIYYSGHTATMIATAPEVQGLNGWHNPEGTLGVGFPNSEGRWHEVWRTDAG